MHENPVICRSPGEEGFGVGTEDRIWVIGGHSEGGGGAEKYVRLIGKTPGLAGWEEDVREYVRLIGMSRNTRFGRTAVTAIWQKYVRLIGSGSGCGRGCPSPGPDCRDGWVAGGGSMLGISLVD